MTADREFAGWIQRERERDPRNRDTEGGFERMRMEK